MPQKPATNSRDIRRKNDKMMLIATLFTLVIVGSGLIALIFGLKALITALPCLLGGAFLILIPWLALTLLEKWRLRIETRELEELYQDSDA